MDLRKWPRLELPPVGCRSDVGVLDPSYWLPFSNHQTGGTPQKADKPPSWNRTEPAAPGSWKSTGAGMRMSAGGSVKRQGLGTSTPNPAPPVLQSEDMHLECWFGYKTTSSLRKAVPGAETGAGEACREQAILREARSSSCVRVRRRRLGFLSLKKPRFVQPWPPPNQSSQIQSNPIQSNPTNSC